MSEIDPKAEADAPSSSASRRSVSLRNLYLDPNNYRFVDHDDYNPVPEDQIANENIQRRTTSFLLGEGTDGIRDLLTSFRKNGWLQLDQIQVRELSKGKYLVVEGNRRVAALKYLQRRYDEGAIELGALSPDFFSYVPIVIYEEKSAAQHLVVMGLAHISGKKKWPPLNQARALRELISKHGWSEEETTQALGMEKRDLRRALGALALSDSYAESEYGDQMTTNKYNLFREVIGTPALRNWIEWDQAHYTARKPENIERLFSWISREKPLSDEESDGSNISYDPAITTGADIRELAKLINDESALRELDESRRLSTATLSSGAIVESKLAECIQRIDDSVSVLFKHTGKLTETHLATVEESLRKLRGLLSARDRQTISLGISETIPINEDRSGHFTSINLEKYRRFKDLEIGGLRRINIFVGDNNSGKTTILEAVQMLASQNDVSALLEITKRRGKLCEDPSPGWVKEQIPEESIILGNFDKRTNNLAKIEIRNKKNAQDVEDKTFYLSTISIDASYGELKQSSVTHLFEKRERITKYSSSRVLCPVAYSSPFVQHNNEFLATLFSKTVEAGVKSDVVGFLKEYVDNGIIDIDQTSSSHAREIARFLVEHATHFPSPDITQFGDGLQRIFQIGLLFSYAKDGIVLIDEFENAIHFKLLLSFTSLIEKLAERFHVQVFLTSHSKECVDAFVRSGSDPQNLMAYTLRGTGPSISCYPYPGEQLATLLEAINIEIR